MEALKDNVPLSDDDLRFLCKELYEGSWELMLEDLNARKNGKPAVYKISDNIEHDIIAATRLMKSSDQFMNHNHTSASEDKTKPTIRKRVYDALNSPKDPQRDWEFN